MLLQTIQNDALAARKASHNAALSEAERAENADRATKLTTLFSEASMVGKNKNRETTEQETVDMVRKFLNGVNDSLIHLSARADDKTQEMVQKLVAEKAMLESYLPKEPTEDELEAVAREALAALGDTVKGPKAMGPIMDALKDRFGLALNRQQASAVAKRVLSA